MVHEPNGTPSEEPPIERFLRERAGLLTGLLLAAATGLVLLAVFGQGQGAGAALCPAILFVVAAMLPGWFLLRQRVMPAESNERHTNEEADSRVSRLLGQNASLLRELAGLIEKDSRDAATEGGFGSATRIRAIGEELDRQGGIELMRAAYSEVRRRGPYFSDHIWDGIGDWRA
ncbi:MAG: hypothetical protein K8U57_34870 [Planctomycetes bacterium]|nr:hypothetical protein [Planctomycetota bacterium]